MQCRLKISFRKLCRVSHNWLLGTDTQQHEAAARHLLRAGQRQRKAQMTLISVCPICGAPGIGYSDKLAAMMDTLMPAQCRVCGKYSIVSPFTVSLLHFPEIIAGPVCFVVWLATTDIRLAAQLGLLAYVGCFGVAAKRARLVAFVREGESKLRERRTRLLWVSAGCLGLLFALTTLIPLAWA